MKTAKIKELRDGSEKQLASYSKQVKQYLSEYGDDASDYLTARRSMCEYYRGAINMLIAVDKILGE